MDYETEAAGMIRSVGFFTYSARLLYKVKLIWIEAVLF